MLTETLHKTFRAHYHVDPDVIYYAPGRVNCIGDHTDYQGGWSLPVALSLGTSVSLRWRDDGQVSFGSDLDSVTWHGPIATLRGSAQEALTHAPLEGLYGFVAAAVDLTATDRGFDLWVSSTLPAGSGLSSSAALALALLSALNWPNEPSASNLVTMAQAIENRYLGVPTGILDQTAIVYAQRDRAVLIDAGSRTQTAMPFDFAGGGYRLWIIDTKTPRTLAASAYDVRVAEAIRAAQVLGVPTLRDAAADRWKEIADPVLRRRARHIISENQRVKAVVKHATEGDWATVADLLSQSHRSLRDDYEVSTPTLDRVVEAVHSIRPTLGEGNAGARLTGAGFGGSVVALVPIRATDRLHEAVLHAFSDDVAKPSLIPIDVPHQGLHRIA